MSNIALLHHFDDSESFSYSGNARNVQGGKFSKCSYFPDDNSFINISNHSGIFNLAPDKPAEFEFFVKPSYIARINSTQEKEMYDAGFRWFNGHSYRILSPALGWFDAKRACEAMQGHLAVFHDDDTHDFINSMLSGSGDVWLGATYENGIINWVDGVQYTPTIDDWFTGQPDGHGKGIQIYNPAGSPYLFDDLDTAAARLFLCEWDFDTRFNSSPYSYYNWKHNHDSIFINGHSFKLFPVNVTYSQAKDACINMGAHLANPDNEALMKKLVDYSWILGTTIAAGGYVGNGYFISFLAAHKDNGVWTREDGKPFTLSNWTTSDANYSPDIGSNNALVIHALHDSYGAYPDSSAISYIAEWDYDLRSRDDGQNILKIGNDFNLAITPTGLLRLTSSAWNADAFSEATLNNNWNHILLRLINNNAYVFINGNLAINAPISGNSLSTDSVTLGGFTGYLDEFIFRNGNDIAYSEYVSVPVKPYGSIANNNAPVTRVNWSCNNLPEGLTLSPSGLLSGRPTKAGTYNCIVSVTTNWGTSNLAVRIVVQ